MKLIHKKNFQGDEITIALYEKEGLPCSASFFDTLNEEQVGDILNYNRMMDQNLKKVTS